MLLYYSPLICYRIRIYMLKQYNGLYNIDYKIQVIQCNECHLERCLSGKCSIHEAVTIPPMQINLNLHDVITTYTNCLLGMLVGILKLSICCIMSFTNLTEASSVE